MRMFRISAETEYAYVALLRLAKDYGVKSSTKLGEIIAPGGLSEKFMLQVLTDLKRAGLVSSRRGKMGGYALAIAPNRITLADLFVATLGDTDDTAGTFEIAGPNSCLAQILRKEAREFQNALSKMSIAQCLSLENDGGPLMYHI